MSSEAIERLKRRAHRGSLFALLLGELRAWRRAREARKAKALEDATPHLLGIVVGETNILSEKGEKLYTQATHRWDLYETPLGERSFVFVAMRKDATSENHRTGVYAEEWLAGLRDARQYETHFGFSVRKERTR